MTDRHFLAKTETFRFLLKPDTPPPPWVDLLSQAAERLAPPVPDALPREDAMAQCQPWSVWVNGVRLRVVYECAAPEDED